MRKAREEVAKETPSHLKEISALSDKFILFCFVLFFEKGKEYISDQVFV